MTTVGLVLAATLAVVGCAPTTDADQEPSPSPTASPSASGSPDPAAEVAAEERMLPMPPDDIADWAETAVPSSDAPGYATGWSGWMSAHTAAHHTSEFRSLAPGTYQGQIACRGDGIISLSAGDRDAEPTMEPVVCTNGTIAFDVTTSTTGMTVELGLEGDPTIYAVSFVTVG